MTTAERRKLAERIAKAPECDAIADRFKIGFVSASDRDTIVAALLAADAASPGSGGEWRPIERAPKDGTWIFGYETRIGMNDKYAAHEVMRWSPRSMLWRSSADKICEPTHWMPLPAPPGSSPSPSVTEEEIIEALEPFAEIAKELLPALKDDDKNSMAWAVPKVGDIRRAARILRLIRG